MAHGSFDVQSQRFADGTPAAALEEPMPSSPFRREDMARWLEANQWRFAGDGRKR